MNNFNFYFNIIGIIFFKIILDFIYVDFVVFNFSYMGFYNDFNLLKYIEGFDVYIILYILLIVHQKHKAFTVLLISFILLITPITTLYAFKNEPRQFFYSMILPYTFMLLLLTDKKISFYYLKRGKNIVIIISIIAISIVFFHYLKIVGFNHINFNLSKVYELRRSDIGISSNYGIFGYLNSWTTKVFNVFLMALSLYYRKYLLFILLVFLQVILFGFSGHKEVLFTIVLVISLYIFEKNYYKVSIVIYSFIFLQIGLLIYFYFTKEIMLPSILIRRVFFVPADLNFIYLDFFSNHDYIYWSNSILKEFISYPYHKPPVFVIGEYLGYPNMAANTGIFGSGYMHMGVIGIVIYCFLLAIYLNIINQLNNLPNFIINTVIILPILSAFISSDLLTVFLTHGALIALLILYLFKKIYRW